MNELRVLALQPRYGPRSEVWLQRMLGMIEDSLVGVACYDPRGANGNIPIADLRPWWGKLAHRCNLYVGFKGANAEVLELAIASSNPSVIFVQYINFALQFQALWRKLNIPLVVHAHGYDVTWEHRRPTWPYYRAFPRNYPERTAELSQTATIIANSEFTRKRLLEVGCKTENIALKYFGIASPPDHPAREPTDKLKCLFVGRLVDCKGPCEVVQAFTTACNSGFKGQLVIIGDGPERQRVEEAIESSGVQDRIELRGKQSSEEVRASMLASHVLLVHNQLGRLTRQEEAFGVTNIEAMACGCPIVGTRSGGVPEIVVDGESGFLVEPGNIAAQAATLIELQENPELLDRVAHAAWRRASEDFSLAQEAKSLNAILRNKFI